MNNVDKYYWIIDHPKLSNKKYGTQPTIELTPHMVNPFNDTIEEDQSLNTKQQWWVEVNVANSYFDPKAVFPDDKSFERSHDWELDCGGNTAEEAVDKLYELVVNKYGDY